MDAIITAAGLGTRSGLNGRFRKEMLPVYMIERGKLVLRPMVESIYSSLRAGGVEKLTVVVDPADSGTIGYIGKYMPDTRIVFQRTRNGYGGAVLSAAYSVRENFFILNAGDGIMLNRGIIERMISLRSSGRYRSILTLMEVDEPEKYGTAVVERDTECVKVRKVVEKEKSGSNLALCALYLLDRSVFDFLSQDRSEIVELTPAIEKSIENGVETGGIIVRRNEWASLGRVEDYSSVVSRTLEFSSSGRLL
jgi:glucose-1-phosphate thymidylyltransferase